MILWNTKEIAEALLDELKNSHDENDIVMEVKIKHLYEFMSPNL